MIRDIRNQIERNESMLAGREEQMAETTEWFKENERYMCLWYTFHVYMIK